MIIGVRSKPDSTTWLSRRLILLWIGLWSGVLQAALPAVTVYERCASHCAPGAVMTVVSSQFRGGQQVQFIDALGRVLRTAKSTLHSGYARNWAGLTLGSFSTVEVGYDARGREVLQVQPSFGSTSPTQATTTDLQYDPLGRVIFKIESFQNAADGAAFGQRTHRRTEYVHNGLTTDIRVCQVASAGAACPASGNNPDGSPVLNLSRTFDGEGGLLWTRDANGQTTKFWSDGAGNVLRITDVKGLSIHAVYDDFGRRTSVTDPSRGTWNFTYNGFGELKTQTDERQLSQSVGYDLLGRKVSRTWTEPRDAETWSFAESWVYENASATQYGVLKSQERQATVGGAERERWSRSYTHDALNRVTGQSTTLRSGSSPALTLTQSQRYDTRSGQLKQSVYPAGSDGRPVSLYHLYDEAGFLRREGFAEDYQSGNPMQSPALRSVLTMDGRGTITQQNYGSRFSGGSEFKDWASHAVYDQSGWLLGLCVNWGGDCSTGVPTIANPEMPLNQRYRYDVYGNLKVQYHRGAWLPSGSQLGEERYSYDPLHRLIGLSRMGASASASVNYAYDEIGNLRKKSDWSFGEGAYQYPSNSHRLTQVSLSNGSATNPQPDGTASYQYDGNGNVTQRTLTQSGVSRVLTVGYDIDNLPWKLSVSGLPQREARYSEGPEGRYWQRLTSSAGTRETAYLGKALEREWSAGVVTDRYYLTEGVLLVVKSSGQRTLNYLHQDRLGSPVSISEKPLPATGGLGTGLVTLVEHRGFDPYGKALDGGWGTSNFGLVNLSPTQPMNVGVRNQRGFTGHEHLDEFELIHMNGRLYDYNLGRFYGVDPFVQFPANSQSLNPYSYLMNNPLAGTDPTGYRTNCGSRIEGSSSLTSDCSSSNIGNFKDDGQQATTPRTSASNGAQGSVAPATQDGTATEIGKPQSRTNQQSGQPTPSWTTRGFGVLRIGGAVAGAVGIGYATVGSGGTCAIPCYGGLLIVADQVGTGVIEVATGVSPNSLLHQGIHQVTGSESGAAFGEGVLLLPVGGVTQGPRVVVQNSAPRPFPSGEAAAGSVNLMRSGDAFLLNASRRQDVDVDGYLDVVVHGTPDAVEIGGLLVNHRVAANLIRNSPQFDGQNIRLISCNTGACSAGFAQNLSNQLGVTVRAPNNLVWAHPSGRLTVGPTPHVNTGSFLEFTPGGNR